MKRKKKLQTVVETPEFIAQAKECIQQKTKDNFISFIAENPEVGDVIPGTGGIRKIRWYKDGFSGKSGGVRIIYLYLNEDIPIFLFTAYGKGKKDNLSMSEKNSLKKLVKQIEKEYTKKR